MAWTPEVEAMSVMIDDPSACPDCCCDLPHLTETQVQVLMQIADRKSSKQAAAALGNSPHTVDSHVKDMLRMTGAGDRGELVRMAIEQKVVDMSTGTAARTSKRCVRPRRR
jgi:DNA-binding CsgD family transcriptional regulator